MIRRADIALILLLVFVVMFATCAKGQTVGTTQLVMKCASGSRISTVSETVLYKRCSDGKNFVSSSTGSFLEFPGSVASVGFSGPAHMSVTGSPITNSGTISLAWQSQAANLVLASPNGSSGVPVFRSLLEADFPADMLTQTEADLRYALLTGAAFTGLVTGTQITTSSNLGVGTPTPLQNAIGTTYNTSRVLNIQAASAVNARFILDGGIASVFEQIDSGATINQRWMQHFWDGGSWTVRALNDSGSLRATGAVWNSVTNTWTLTNLSVSGTCTGCSGTGDQNNVGTWASRPAGGVNAGNTYQPTDSPYMQIDDGSALVYFGPRYRFYLPVLGDFTAINQGTATADQTNGPVWVQGPATGTATLRSWVKTAPATPYTITIAVQTQLIADVQFAGFTWRDSATDKHVTCYMTQTAGLFSHYTAHWTTSSSFSADAANTTEADSVYNTNRTGINWIRAADDGTSRTCSWSVDGVHFYQWYTATRTTFATANQVGFAIGGSNASNTVQMNLYSWLQQ